MATFDFSLSPFDCLSSDEQRLVRDHVDIGYYREGAALLAPGTPPACLFVVIKGRVQQRDGEEVVATYAPGDTFDGRALVAGKASSRFVAEEEVLVHQVSREAVTELISRNATFGALLFADLSNKLNALAARANAHELPSLTMASVGEAYLRPIHEVGAGDDIVSVVKVFMVQGTGNVLVRDDASEPPRLGIFTTTGLQRAILHGTPLDRLPVGELATWNLVTVRPQDTLFDALTLMIRHQVHRLVVQDGTRMLGFLEQLDLLGFLSNHSTLITRQIVQAQDLQALAHAALQINRLIALLWRGGTKVGPIARLVCELNAKLFDRAWHLVAPPGLVANSCLFVMGSEGRGEQLLKTDQDNGLVLRDGYEPPADFPEICQRFSDALTSFGYPECPGRIMVSNPAWRMHEQAFGETVRRWLLMPNPDSLMALAIFIDAHPVCGDASLLASVRARIDDLVIDSDAMLARFAAAISAFEQGSGWWNRIFSLGGGEGDDAPLDLKKAGIFPLVHGVRSLALEARIAAPGTVERIEALRDIDRLPPDLAADMIDALYVLMGLKLDAGLIAQESARENGSQGRVVRLEDLTSLQRALLKDALAVVKRFKGLLRHRYHLDMM